MLCSLKTEVESIQWAPVVNNGWCAPQGVTDDTSENMYRLMIVFMVRVEGKKSINIETRRSTTPGKRVILVQGPC